MSEALQGFAQRARTDRGWWVAGAMVTLAFVYPFIVEYLQDIPFLGDFVPAQELLAQGIAHYTPQQHRASLRYGGHDPGWCCRKSSTTRRAGGLRIPT